MLPAMASRFNPALAIMKSITTWQEQTASRTSGSVQLPAPAAPQPVNPSARSTANEAVSAYFSVHHVTANELIIKMVGHIAGRLNAELAANADHSDDTAEVSAQKEKWRQTALKLPFRDAAANGELTLPKPSDNGITFREVAQIILDMFNHDFLAKHSDLVKELEDMIGFHLGGLTLLDILQAAADPDSSVAERVDKALAKGLAGRGEETDSSSWSSLAESVYRATIRELRD